MTDKAGRYEAERLRDGQDCLDAALIYLARGWSVLGICPPDHVGVGKVHGDTCDSPGKRPWPDGGTWKHWQDERPDEATVRRWWSDHPGLNVGMALGPVSGLVRIDVEGEAAEAELSRKSGGDLPATLEFRSGRADGTGRGLLYAIPPGVELRTTTGHEKDGELRVQAKGAQTVLPPSRHASGGRYAWVAGHGPGEIQAAPAPAWLLAELSPEAKRDGRRTVENLAEGELIVQGQRDDTLTSFAGTMRKRGMPESAIYAALDAVNSECCEPPLPDEQVRKIARSVARYERDPLEGVRIKLPVEPGVNGQAPESAPVNPEPFPTAIPSSELRLADSTAQWIWHGYLARGSITLLSALWKAGKTTLIAYLLKCLEEGKEFCGLSTKQSKVLYVTEEHESLWAERRDRIGLTDHIRFLVRPFASKPRWERWQEFLAYLRGIRTEWPYDLLVLDPISNLWPVRDENDAPQVQSALMPLHRVGDDLSTLLNHHLRKGDGAEATAARGSGALSAFCDTLMELRRYAPGDRKDRRRVLTGYGRHTETTDELVVEWTMGGYAVHGDRSGTEYRDIAEIIDGLLPCSPPGFTRDEIVAEWPRSRGTSNKSLLDALRTGCEDGRWVREGTGSRGSPHRYWIPPKDSIPFPPLRGGAESNLSGNDRRQVGEQE